MVVVTYLLDYKTIFNHQPNGLKGPNNNAHGAADLRKLTNVNKYLIRIILNDNFKTYLIKGYYYYYLINLN